MQKTVRWGIIGCGDVVERKAGPSYATARGSSLTAVMRRDADKVHVYAARHGIPFWTTDAGEIIDHPEVDAVYIATPPAFQVEHALRACAAGKPCLVEKPAGRSAEECARMVEAFAAAGVPLFVSYYRRHLPKFRKVKEILDAGELGPLVSVAYRCVMPPLKGGWRVSPEICGGGRFFDVGCHILDLLDDWLGPLTFAGGSAANALPGHQSEDAVALSFYGFGGTVGTALWNFAGTRAVDEIEIEGLWGRLRLACMECFSPVQLEVRSEYARRPQKSALKGWIRRLRGKSKWKRWRRERLIFEPLPFVQAPMIQAVVDALLAPAPATGNGEAALRTSALMDQALDAYYGGRRGAFWQRPASWRSLRTTAARGDGAGDHALSAEESRLFDERGYLGPYACGSSSWRRLHITKSERLNLHLEDPLALELCSHPSIVDRVRQLLGPAAGVSLFKSRIWVKPAEAGLVVPWHQDIGANNGGCYADGRPVPTLTVWLALDAATSDSGGVRVIPGSHKQLFGDWQRSLLADLETSGALDGVDLDRSALLEAQPGEFYIFHSWILHSSPANRSRARRAGINMRFAACADALEPDVEYLRLREPV